MKGEYSIPKSISIGIKKDLARSTSEIHRRHVVVQFGSFNIRKQYPAFQQLFFVLVPQVSLVSIIKKGEGGGEQKMIEDIFDERAKSKIAWKASVFLGISTSLFLYFIIYENI